MKERGNLLDNTVVTTIMSNYGLYKAFDAVGIQYKKTDVGDRYVYEAMKEHDHLLGGEQSGHIIFRKYANTGDGMLTAIKLMQAMIAKEAPLSKLAEPVTIYPQVLKNLKVRDKDAAMDDPKVLAAAQAMDEKLAGHGRVLLRKSGTEPVVRVMAEAETKEECQEAVDSIVTAIAAQGHLTEEKHA
jgi:phosphoglucosamine mutase